jgi:hypothetical protein
VQFTSHPAIVCGTDWLYSRDYVDALTNSIKERYGADVVVVFANGAQGNMVAADPYKPFVTGFEEAERVGRLLAGHAIRGIGRILGRNDFKNEIQIRSAIAPLALPIRKIPDEDVSRARELIALAESAENVLLHGLDPRVEGLSILEMADYPNKEETSVLQAVRLGPAYMIAFPGEVFIEHALSVFARLPAGVECMAIGLANDYVGYIPTKVAFGEGGYEVKTSRASSRYAPEAGELLVEGSLALLSSIISPDANP